MTSLYQALTVAGCEIDHHESDLYVKLTPTALAVIRTFPGMYDEGSRFMFRSKVDGKMWLDFPFAYEPFWAAKQHAPAGVPTTC